MRLLFTLIACIICSLSHAQEQKHAISAPIDIREQGVNKVLCMKNGNTLLFHFEPVKNILVKVFDGSHKEVAGRQDKYHELDISMVEYVAFKGLYEINGEAVMFIEQDRFGKHCLLMLRYNGQTGALVEERLVGESKSENKRIKFYVIKNKEDDNYEILFCMDKRHPKENDMYVVFFNSKHESIKEMQLEIDRKKYDYLDVIGAESQPQGLLISVSLDKPVIYGRANDLNTTDFAHSDHDSAIEQGGSVYDHYLTYYYIPKDTNTIRRTLIDVSRTVFPYYAIYTYNPFADAINLLLHSFKPTYYKFGLDEYFGTISSNLFFKIDVHDMNAEVNIIKNSIANDDYRRKRDTTKYFEGMPVKMFTNENGLSTIVSQSFLRYGEPETHARYDYQDYFGNICITQFDDAGKEIWGSVLPMAQYFNSNKQYYNEKELRTRWQDQTLFGDLPAQVYGRQFLSFNTYNKDKDFYIIYNDYNKNFNNSLAKAGDTVYGFGTTNACYYKIGRKREITKHYLFGVPPVGEYKCSFIEGADFDEQRGVYATLIQYKKRNKTMLCMAWAYLE